MGIGACRGKLALHARCLSCTTRSKKAVAPRPQREAGCATPSPICSWMSVRSRQALSWPGCSAAVSQPALCLAVGNFGPRSSG
jgi:hypothetical protein